MNNAGFVLGVDRVGTINDDEIESMFQVNVLGLISLTQILVRGLCGALTRVELLHSG